MEELSFLVINYPAFRYFVLIMIISRIVCKPLFGILGKYIDFQINVKKDSRLDKLLHKRWYIVCSWIVDLLFSVKLPQVKE